MSKLKISLVRPNYHSHLITPPLGLGYLSSYLKSQGHRARVIDGLNLNLNNKKIAALCYDADLVGISILSAYLSESIDLIRILKANKKKVVIGGPHVTALGHEALCQTEADFAICFEGELSLTSLAENIANNKKNERLSQAGFIDNLDLLPFPDWKEISPRFYQKAPHGGLIKKFPAAPIVTTRGCPYECAFCASPKLWERKIRFRSPENTVEEIEYLVKSFGVKEIHFEDDNLTLKKEHVIRICELLIAKNLKISWATPNGVRADKLDREILKLMKRSGCYFTAFGIESASQRILGNIKKSIELESISKAISIANKEGIITQGFFIFGLPGETKETMRETINFAKKSGLRRAQFLLLDVLPGSGLWEKLKSSRCTQLTEAKSYQDVTWIPEGLKKEDLLRAQSQAFREFFFRPRQLYTLLKHFKPGQISFVLRRVSDFRMFKF